MTSFIIKLIACFTMILDHIKYAIPVLDNGITEYLGRISYPLFAFLLVEGYVHTSNLNKYYKRLFVFALISQIPFMLFRTLVGDWKVLNIMFTLILGLIAITVYDKVKKEYISFPLCIIIILIGKVIKVDYEWYGVAVILILYIFRENKILKIISYSLLTLLNFYILGYDLSNIIIIKFFIAYLIPLIFITLYNGKQGRKIKYFFYWFYPIHMLIVYGLSFLFL